MSYEVNVSVKLIKVDDGEIVTQAERSYAIKALSEIPVTFDHVGKSVALLAEGVEKLGLIEDETTF